MTDRSTLCQIEADLLALRARVDALNDPRLDSLSGRLLASLAVLRPLTRSGVERFVR